MFISVMLFPLTHGSMTRLIGIQSLFGMNIDVLADNPAWWLYAPVAAGTSLLTLVVWLAFKYSNNVSPNPESLTSKAPW